MNKIRLIAVYCLALMLFLTASVVAAPIAPNQNVAKPGEMVLVEGGTFIMGDTFGDDHPVNRYKDARPTRQVKVNSFFIGKYEVTFDEYETFLTGNGRKHLYSQEVYGKNNRPIVKISWYDAVTYCNWLSKKEGLTAVYTINDKNVTCDFTANGYRLPTEAEWEYAAKGGNKSKGFKFSGSNTYKEVGWFGENSGMNWLLNERTQRNHPIGQKQPNELGIYDMSGNMSEWCWDYFSSYSKDDIDNPKGPATGKNRVLRGGNFEWDAVTTYCRAGWNPEESYVNNMSTDGVVFGFRIVKNVTP